MLQTSDFSNADSETQITSRLPGILVRLHMSQLIYSSTELGQTVISSSEMRKDIENREVM